MNPDKNLLKEMELDALNNQTVGDIIYNARIEKGISQRELAKELNISKSYMNNLENNKVKKPGYMTLFEISRILELKKHMEYWLFLYSGYSAKEMVKLGILDGCEGIEAIGYDYVDKEDRIRINLVKALKDYRNRNLTEKEMINIINTYYDLEKNPNYKS